MSERSAIQFGLTKIPFEVRRSGRRRTVSLAVDADPPPRNSTSMDIAPMRARVARAVFAVLAAERLLDGVGRRPRAGRHGDEADAPTEDPSAWPCGTPRG